MGKRAGHTGGIGTPDRADRNAQTTGDGGRGPHARHARTLLDAAAEGLALTEPLYDAAGAACDYRILEANAAFRRLTGIGAEPVHGGSLCELLPEDAQEALLAALAAALASGRPVQDAYRPRSGAPARVDVFRAAPDQLAIRLSPQPEADAQRLAFLEGLVQSMPVGLGVLDSELRYVQVNERLAQLNGVAAAAHLGRTVEEVVPQLAPQLRPNLQWVADRGEPLMDIHVSGETPADPAVRCEWIEHYWPVRDARAVVQGVGVLVHEVSEQLRREAVRRLEQELHTAAENVSDAISRFDLALRRVYVNPATAKLFGRPREQLLGKTNPEAAFSPEFCAAYDAVLRRVIETGQRQHAELRLPRPDGDRVIEVDAIPELAAGGRLDTVLAVKRDITARKRAEAELRESEAKYRDLVESLYEGVWLIDAQDRTTFVNCRMAEMLGYPREDMLGQALSGYMESEQLAVAMENIGRGRAGERAEYEVEYRRRDASRICARVATTPLFDAQGRYRGALAAVEDITAQKRAEAALRSSQERFRKLIDLAPAVLYRVPVPGFKAEFISPEVERLTGFSREEWQSDPDIWVRQLHEADRARVIGQMQAALEGGADSYTQEYRLWHKDGRTLCWLEDRHRIERDAQGRPVALFGAIVDIAERKRTEETVRVLEQEFRLLAERSPDTVARIDADMRFLYVSPAVERMTGRPPSHYVGKTLREVGLSDNYVPAFEAAVRTALAGEESTIEYSFMATGRGPRVLEGRLAPEYGPGEGPRAVIAVTRDITALREAEARLREEAAALERANERLAALSRHDPLTGLANRRYLMEYLGMEWRREARHDALISMVLADIDHFKAYNDRYGHLAGDECLRRVAGALRAQAHRPGDLLARYGGEEFVLIMPETPLAGARRVAEALRAAVQGLQIEHAASPTAPHVTISLGVAEVAPRSQSADELFARADAAMYAAKSRGRNRVSVAGED